ncbi:SphA family protein [Acidocella facilis]|uniref:SphA family protein n=1 Tax=Acidocella facilis TaxID=525 RepID=UPI001F18270A|nr:transporter [Acidocella facilis]
MKYRTSERFTVKGSNVTILAMATVLTFAATEARAEELWDPYLRGVSAGQPAGALPPPGVYGELDNYLAEYSDYNSSGNKIPGTHLTALVEVPIVLWVPGIKILGANYAAAIGQPFDYTSFQPFQHDFGGGGGNLGTYNTVLVPYMLSWSLPHNFFIKNGLTILLPDASSTMNDFYHGKVTNGGAPSGNAFTTIQPDLGVSWLYNGWDVSVGTHFTVNVSSDPYNDYHSATQFSADYTVTKTIHQWTVGLTGSQENQLNNDSENGVSVPGTKVSNYSIGPVAGYQFANGLGVTFIWNHGFGTRNDVAGDFFDFRLTTAF